MACASRIPINFFKIKTKNKKVVLYKTNQRPLCQRTVEAKALVNKRLETNAIRGMYTKYTRTTTKKLPSPGLYCFRIKC